MKKTLLTILAVGMIGCTGGNNYIPERNFLNSVKEEPYDIKTNKCTHKSFKYRKYLEKKGIKTRLVGGWIEGYKEKHMWVEVYNKSSNTWHLIDPTFINNDDGWNINQYPERRIFWKEKALKK